MAICAITSGAESYNGIVEFSEASEEWLRRYFELPNGISSHDTFNRVFSQIDPKQFQKCFNELIKELSNLVKGEIVSIDGKTLRGSSCGSSNQKAIHMVSAWANENQVVLGQIKTEDKSNEITAISKLLELLELKNTIVTIDAMGTQKKIAEAIIEKEADYILALKKSQGTLYNNVELFFDSIIKDEIKDVDVLKLITKEKNHGRIETRKYYLVNDISWLDNKGNRKNIKSIGMVERERIVGDKETFERSYYITSLESIELFSKDVRQHWGIENKLHWVLDVSFNEDKRRARKNNSAGNLAVLRHLSLNLLREEKTSKKSLNLKKLRCALDKSYLEKVIFNPLRGKE
nr:ISAs1 family transposase [Clostridium sp. JN-1]